MPVAEVCRQAAVLVAFLLGPSGAEAPACLQAYDAAGQPVALTAVLDRMVAADVAFLGEQHDDANAHELERAFLEAVHRLISDYAQDRPVVLALEMVEADVQPVLDEYLKGLIEEQDWLEDGRPWNNYADYRPLFTYAREHGIPVVGTNAPRRYARRAVREDSTLYDGLQGPALGWLAPTPIAPPSDPLAARFAAAMGTHAHGGPSLQGLLAAQNLKDATMAWHIARTLNRNAHPDPVEGPGYPLVIHVNGSFHSADGLGIPEHLARYAPHARTLVVTMQPGDPSVAPPVGEGTDFVIVTASE